MAALTQRQRVKINAALSLIHSEGYDAQAVVNWAREYQQKGRDPRTAYQQALNEFIQGQPNFADPLGKIVRLVEASDVPTLVKYDEALTTYIQTGDDSGVAALGPMIAQDSVALAARHGELASTDLTPEAVAAATGLTMADEVITAASQPPPTSPPQQFAFERKVDQGAGVALDAPARPSASQVSPYAAGGRVADKSVWNKAFDGTRLNANANTGSYGSRTLVAGHVIAPQVNSAQDN